MAAIHVSAIGLAVGLAIGLLLLVVAALLLHIYQTDRKSRKNIDFSGIAASTVLSEIDSAVILLNASREVVSANPAASVIFPKLVQENRGRPIHELVDFPKDFFERNVGMEFNVDSCAYEGRVKPIEDKDGALWGYVIVVMDMTETFRYVDELVEMRQRAESANRAKSDFITNMSHEIRTPMNAIVGLSNLIMEESDGQKVHELAGEIKSASQSLLAIISDILDLSKADSGKMRLVEQDYMLPSLMNDLVSAMRTSAAHKGLEFFYQFDGEIPCKLHGDVRRIRQILNNILGNAIKFTSEGSINLAVSYERTEEDEFYLVFYIADTGIGIKEEHLEKIFENFQQIDAGIKRKTGGTGLGLSISRKLAELMRGSVTVYSVYGSGSTFVVTIPQKIVDATTIHEMEQMETGQEQQMFTAPDYRILVVDDNLINRKVVQGALKPYGCQVMEAESGAVAIELAKDNPVDLIFMDHMMPEMDGVETAQAIRQECGENAKDAIIIALTANASDGIQEMFLQNGFQGFMSKPIDSQLLFDLLSKWIPDEKKQYGGAVAAHDISQEELDGIFIRGVDVEKALKRHSGTLDDYLNLLLLFQMDGERKRPYLQELCQKGDWVNYQIEAHALKGAAANIGALGLSERARLLEMAARDGDHRYILEHHERLDHDYQALMLEIQSVIEKRRPAQEEDEAPRQQVSREKLIQMAEEALGLLEHFRPKECAKKVDGLLQCDLSLPARKRMEEARGKLRFYEDDDAEDILRAAIQEIKQGES